jgi:hypothetical protein
MEIYFPYMKKQGMTGEVPHTTKHQSEDDIICEKHHIHAKQRFNFHCPDIISHMLGQALQHLALQHSRVCFTLWDMRVAYLSCVTNV